VLFVGPDGRIQRTVGGFARPVNAWPLQGGAVLIPDEHAASLIRINPDGTKTTLLRGLGFPDDVVTDSTGAIFTDSLTRNDVVQVVNGKAVELASGLGQPQGLGADPADNLIVTEEDNGRVDAIVRTFKLPQGLASAPALAAGKDACVALDRAPGFTGAVTIDPGSGYTVTTQPGTGSVGAIRFTGCTGLCRVRVTVHSGARTDAVWVQARVS
jgi:hypothetical protein